MIAGATELELDSDALRTEAESLRDQVEQLGPVNVLAIEEHDETVKRLDFLTAQRQDLYDARNSLQQAIREISRKCSRTFTKVVRKSSRAVVSISRIACCSELRAS